jgi:hypothetical protein
MYSSLCIKTIIASRMHVAGCKRKCDTIPGGIRAKPCIAQRLTTKELVISEWSMIIYHLAAASLWPVGSQNMTIVK